MTAGFAVGGAYHDYSMSTLIRDHRGAGHICSKSVGYLLQRAGIDIWYWGCKIGYFEHYDAYGGRDFERKEFWNRWSKAAARDCEGSVAIPDTVGVEDKKGSKDGRVTRKKTFVDEVERVLRADEGLVPALDGW